MEDEVLKGIEDVIKNRVLENENIFNDEEVKIILNNYNVIFKIYLLGLLDLNS